MEMSALVSMLKRRLAITWLGWAVAGMALVAIPVTNHFTLMAAMGQMRFVAMDSRSTFYLTSAGSFEESKHIHAELAKMAAETIFNRNPGSDNGTQLDKPNPYGFDNPERLERLFNPETTTALNNEAAKDVEVFRQQQIHQKIETGQIREISVDSATALVSVEGQVLRTGTFNSRVVNDAKRVTVFLRLTLNNDMARNGRYPLVVTNYEERFE